MYFQLTKHPNVHITTPTLFEIILFSLIISASFQQYSQYYIPCENISDCFTCVATSTCNWNPKTNTCSNGSYSQFQLMFSTSPPCTDENSISIQNKFCGSEEIIFDNNKAKKQLPNVLNFYGTKNLFCTYVLEIKENSTSIIGEIAIERYYLNNIYMEIQVSFDEEVEEKRIDSTLIGLQIKKAKIIKIFYFQSFEFSEVPFQITFQKESTKISMTLILTVVLVFVLLIICGLGAYLFSRRMAKKNQNTTQQTQSQTQSQSELQLKKEKEIRIMSIKTFIHKNLKKILFNSEIARISNNCTICLDEYNEESEVVKTECGHVFHYKCLESWLFSNIMNVKCPNCNYYFLEMDRVNKDVMQSRIILNQPTRIQVVRNLPVFGIGSIVYGNNISNHNDNNIQIINTINSNHQLIQLRDNIQNITRIENSNNYLLGGNNINNIDYISQIQRSSFSGNINERIILRPLVTNNNNNNTHSHHNNRLPFTTLQMLNINNNNNNN